MAKNIGAEYGIGWGKRLSVYDIMNLRKLWALRLIARDGLLLTSFPLEHKTAAAPFSVSVMRFLLLSIYKKVSFPLNQGYQSTERPSRKFFLSSRRIFLPVKSNENRFWPFSFPIPPNDEESGIRHVFDLTSFLPPEEPESLEKFFYSNIKTHYSRKTIELRIKSCHSYM